MHNISSLKVIQIPHKPSSEASLYIFESLTHIPMTINRVFTIHATHNCQRGFHAHKECTQFLVALKGTCTVICDDGYTRKKIVLSSPQEGLFIPPTIWAQQEYEESSILMVLADQPYNESDYIRDYDMFLNFRGIK